MHFYRLCPLNDFDIFMECALAYCMQETLTLHLQSVNNLWVLIQFHQLMFVTFISTTLIDWWDLKIRKVLVLKVSKWSWVEFSFRKATRYQVNEKSNTSQSKQKIHFKHVSSADSYEKIPLKIDTGKETTTVDIDDIKKQNMVYIETQGKDDENKFSTYVLEKYF